MTTRTYAILEPDSSGLHITEPLAVRCTRWDQAGDQAYSEAWFEPHEVPVDWVMGDAD